MTVAAVAVRTAACALVGSAAAVAAADGGDLLALKREQYRRVLLPPQEAALDAAALLRFVGDPQTDLKAMARFEQVMDCRAALYAYADRLNHRRKDDRVVRRMLDTGYRAVNALDLTGASAVAKALGRRFAREDPDVPLTVFNPFSWLKNFTQWGYVKHPDGMTLYEPDPWNMTWQDGFVMNVAQDGRVATAACAASEPRYRETRFSASMADVSVARDWVSTRWRLRDRRVTFSVLTPVVDVDDVEALTLSGFAAAPDKLAWIGRSGQWRVMMLTEKATFEPQVVASAIQDFSEPPPGPPPVARGIQPIEPNAVDRPWLILSAQGKWDLILLPGARPVAAGWEKGVFTLRFPRKTYVGLLKAPANLHAHEYPGVAEFFAGVASSYPRTCREVAKGDAVGWRYSFERRTNDWNVAPHEIAPLPPLADLAGVRAPETRCARYPTKWNLMRYAEGDTVRCAQPPKLARAQMLRGVNVGLAHFGDLTNHVAAGANWVRIVLDAGKPLERNLRELEGHLRNPSFASAKFLVDPHSLEYGIGWAHGIPGPEAEDRYVAMWGELAKLGAKHPNRIAGYDLCNEPGIVDGSEARWRQVAARATAEIRRYDPQGRIYFTGVYGGNANGFFNLMPIEGEDNQSMTFHFYSPCAFTHQKCQTHRGDDPFVWYPGWEPAIDWARGVHYGGTNVDWYDRWTLAALMLPALEHFAQWNVPLHCGEFSVIGYANGGAGRGAMLWTRDVVELLEHAGVPWNIWNWGFGMCHPDVAEYMHRQWMKDKGEGSK